MRKNKTLSSLSLAAVAVVAAAVPCFAQDHSSESRAAENSLVAASGAGFEMAFNRESRATAPRNGLGSVEPKNIVDTAPVVTSPATLSKAAFKGTDRSALIENKFSFNSQLSWYEAPSFNSKSQFRVDDESVPERSTKLITFVPSRGQKLPN